MERGKMGFGLYMCLIFSFLLFGMSSPAAGQLEDTEQDLGDNYSRKVGVGDLDGDCDLDAFVVNATEDGHRVWLNNGSGGFVDSGQVLDDKPGFGGALGDLDDDGDLDAFVVYGTNIGDKVWLNDGNGNFSESPQELGGDIRHAAALGDLDGDGDLDAISCGTSSITDYDCNTWQNNGSALFTKLQGFTIEDSTSNGVALGDLDGDNDVDAFITGSDTVEVWLNDGSGMLTQHQTFDGGYRPQEVALGDCDGDDDLDAFVVNQSSGHKVFLNDGSANLTDSGQEIGPLDVGKFRGVDLGDLDCDGDLDAVVTSQSSNQASLVFLNDGSCNFTQAAWDLGTGYKSFGVALGDLDGDGGLDAFVANMSEGNRVYLNNQPCDYFAPCPGCKNNYSGKLSFWGRMLGFYSNTGNDYVMELRNRAWMCEENIPTVSNFGYLTYMMFGNNLSAMDQKLVADDGSEWYLVGENCRRGDTSFRCTGKAYPAISVPSLDIITDQAYQCVIAGSITELFFGRLMLKGEALCEKRMDFMDPSAIWDYSGGGSILLSVKGVFRSENICGNNIVEQPWEECEPPGIQGCNNKCQLNPVCGNGIIENDEECEIDADCGNPDLWDCTLCICQEVAE